MNFFIYWFKPKVRDKFSITWFKPKVLDEFLDIMA
jgi:hypothetical protein